MKFMTSTPGRHDRQRTKCKRKREAAEESVAAALVYKTAAGAQELKAHRWAPITQLSQVAAQTCAGSVADAHALESPRASCR